MDDEVDAIVEAARAHAAALGATLEVSAAAEGTDLHVTPRPAARLQPVIASVMAAG